MNKTQKREAVQALTERLNASPNLYLTDFTGISVKQITTLRRRLTEQGASFVVVKNTLARRALEAASVEGLEDNLAGPTAFVFAGADPFTAAKILADFRRETEQRPAIKAGVVDGRAVGPDEVQKLASLPTRDELMGQLAGAFQGPLAGWAAILESFVYQFAGLLESLRAERETA